MDDALIYWDDEPGQNLEKITLRGLTPEEVEAVIRDGSIQIEDSWSSGRPCKQGVTPTGRYIFVTWDVLSKEPLIIYPVTAYEPDPD
jgi:hypothetical protein